MNNTFVLDDWLRLATSGIEAAGVGVILLGVTYATFVFAWEALRCRTRGDAYQGYRSRLGRSILLGLELLVAADIIHTVAVELTFQSLAVLAAVVLIRTFLSFSLEVELEGRWPWQRERVAASDTLANHPDAPEPQTGAAQKAISAKR